MSNYDDLIHFLNDILGDIQLETYYLQDIKDDVDRNNLMVTCPSHKGGRESSPSCGINIKSGDAKIMGELEYNALFTTTIT